MEDWQLVASDADAAALMAHASDFHDASIANVRTSMHRHEAPRYGQVGDAGSGLAVMLTLEIPKGGGLVRYELLFTEVVGVYLAGLPSGFVSNVMSAFLMRKDELIFWADDDLWDPSKPPSWKISLESPEAATSWVVAKGLRWRSIAEMG
jgi:hypothetical protein